MAYGQAGAPAGNKNRQGKTKDRKRIQVSMGISDHVKINDTLYADLRKRFEEYLLAQGIPPDEDEIKSVARRWAYEAWWLHLKRAEDDQAIII